MSTSEEALKAPGMRLLAVVCAGVMLAANAAAAAERLELTVGASTVIDCPADVTRISTSTPEVVDAAAVTRREVLLQAKSSGFSSVILWTSTGERRVYAVKIGRAHV